MLRQQTGFKDKEEIGLQLLNLSISYLKMHVCAYVYTYTHVCNRAQERHTRDTEKIKSCYMSNRTGLLQNKQEGN